MYKVLEYFTQIKPSVHSMTAWFSLFVAFVVPYKIFFQFVLAAIPSQFFLGLPEKM
jgi:hypothetical protein